MLKFRVPYLIIFRALVAVRNILLRNIVKSCLCAIFKNGFGSDDGKDR